MINKPSVRDALLTVILALMPMVSVSDASAEEEKPTPDKDAYSLLHPVPNDKLRDFSSDRPGKAQSAITIDAGRFQVETGLLFYSYDPRGASQTTTRGYSVGMPIFKVGVTNWIVSGILRPRL